MPSYDAIVIGAGPAGSSAARLLALRGWRTALIEHGPRHRGKACGDCLSARAATLLDRAGLLDGVRGLAAGATRRVRVHVDANRTIGASLPADGRHRPGLLVERHRLDQFLTDRAAEEGVEVVQPGTARIGRITARDVLVHVAAEGRTRDLRAGLVVGADGLRSSVARAAGIDSRRLSVPKYGFAGAFGPTRGRCDAVTPETIEMFLVPGGYIGVVNLGGGLLHVAGLVGGDAKPAGGPAALIERAARRFGLMREAGLDGCRGALQGRLLGAGPMPSRPRHVARGRVALVGDAAGFVEPFTGEGMSWALESAETLAAVAGDGWNAAAAARYRTAWARGVGRRQRRCRLIAGALQRPFLRGALAHLAGGHPSVLRYLVTQAVTR